MMQRLLVFLFAFVITQQAAFAQNLLPFVSSTPQLVLPAVNNASIMWQNAGLLSSGGIPTRSTVCATVNASGVIVAGPTDDQANILAAINGGGCVAGQVVMLGTGTFNLFLSENPMTIKKGVSLRGTGAPVGPCDASMGTACWGTVVQTYDGPQPTYNPSAQCGITIGVTTNCPSGVAMIRMGSSNLFDTGWGQNSSSCNWPATAVNPTTNNCGTTLTADAAAGDTTVHVTSTSHFSVSQVVLIDENPALVSTTNPVVGQAAIQASPEFLNSTPTPSIMRVANPDANNCTYTFCTNRVNQELHVVASMGVGTITFDAPLTMGFRSSGGHDARLYWPTNASGTPLDFLQGAGIENMTLTRCNGGCVDMTWCNGCWVHGVEANWWIAGAVNMDAVLRSEVSFSYLHNCIDCQNNGAEYPLGISSATTQAALFDSIITFGGKGMVGRASNTSVIAYNYVDKTYYMAFSGSIGDYWNDMGLNCSHYAGTHHCLFEGNYGPNCDGDETHGNMIYMTFFRNQCAGYRTTFVDPSNTLTVNDCAGIGYTNINTPQPNGFLRAGGPMGFGYWMAFVGNVMGQAGMQSCSGGAFVLNGTSGSTAINRSIWGTGWTGGEWANGIDSNLKTNNATAFIFRNCNYDYVTTTQADCAVGYSHILPNSLYLSGGGPPSFWPNGSTTYPYPPFDASSGTPVKTNSLGGPALPAKARYVAGTPFNNP